MAAGADGRPSREDLDALADRLAEHERRRADEERRRRRRAASPYGFGFRLVTELVAGVAAGFLGGWALDRWLDASPWFVLLLTPMGMAAGILNVVRAARSAEGERHLDAIAAAEEETRRESGKKE